MRIGLYVPAFGAIDGTVQEVRTAEAAGLDSVFFPQLMSWDTLTVAALAGREVPRIGLGTAVVRTHSIHPLALAGQALSVQAAIGNRLTLGIGPGHREMIEGQYGLSYDKPARHAREYLTALQSLLSGRQTDYHGESITAVGTVEVPGSTPPSVLLSALGPVMLGVAGELADGTVTVWTGPELIGDRIAPTVTEAAAKAGRHAPRIVATIIMSVTADPDGVRRDVAARVGAAGQFANYRRLLEQQGKAGVADTAVIGDEDTVAEVISQFAKAGVTELVASVAGDDQDRARTIELLGRLRESGPVTV